MTSTPSRTADVSNPGKPIFPGHSKLDLVRYYEGIADAMLPHIAGRPLSLYRFPRGAGERGFYQKNIPAYFPKWVSHMRIGAADYIVCDSTDSLVFVGSLVAEFHTAAGRAQAPERPDKLVFDLDPAGDDQALLKNTARKVGKLLGDIGLTAYVMATGKSGYHVAAPILPELDNAGVRDFALKVARVIEADDPEHITTELARGRRGGRLFLDVNRNSPRQTSIAPYSVRATETASVALPIGWGELKASSPGGFDISAVLGRMRKKPDAWRGFDRKRASLKTVVAELKR
jgi:bifunctional non-homologous end joining protein LigD